MAVLLMCLLTFQITIWNSFWKRFYGKNGIEVKGREVNEMKYK